MKKLLFGITNLEIGGAEKVLVDIVNKLSSEYEIEILTIYDNGILLKDINKKIKITSLFNKTYKETSYLKRKYISLLMLNKMYRKKIYSRFKDKDIIISFLEGPVTSLFSDFAKYKIVWVHTDLSKHYSVNKLLKIKNDYAKYNKIVFVSNECKKSFDNFYNNKFLSKEIIINNYIDSKRVINLSNADLNYKFKTPNFLVISRLVEAKGIERLINVHELLIKYGFKNYIYVIGTGPLKEKLELTIQEKKLEETFILLGQKENPYPYIKYSDTILIPSLYEGYGMSAVEAKILGKKIITTKTGVIDAISDYEKKVICENNEPSLYEALKADIERRFIECEKNIYKFNSNEIIGEIKNILEAK